MSDRRAIGTPDLNSKPKSCSISSAEAEEVAVRPDTFADATSDGACQAGPRVERAQARQQRDASTAPVTLTVNASDITDAKAFVAFLQEAGFSRAFAKRVTNRDAFKAAAEPTPDDSQIAEAIRSTFAGYGRLLEG